MPDRMDRLEDRISRVEDQFWKEVKENKDTLNKIEKSLAVLNAKQHMGAWFFKIAITLIAAALSGFFGAHFSK